MATALRNQTGTAGLAARSREFVCCGAARGTRRRWPSAWNERGSAGPRRRGGRGMRSGGGERDHGGEHHEPRRRQPAGRPRGRTLRERSADLTTSAASWPLNQNISRAARCAVPGRGPAPRCPARWTTPDLGDIESACWLPACAGSCAVASPTDGQPRPVPGGRGRPSPGPVAALGSACRCLPLGSALKKVPPKFPRPTPELSGSGQDGRVLLMLPSCHGRKTA